MDTDPELYRMCAETFPDAWLEDPDINDETRPVLEPHWDRITWDAPIHSVADIEALERKPRTVNIKPSRFGRVEELCNAYDHCEREGIGAYGGGQTELAEGRGQIQYLASLFHPDTPNDTAPGGYNMSRCPTGCPSRRSSRRRRRPASAGADQATANGGPVLDGPPGTSRCTDPLLGPTLALTEQNGAPTPKLSS